MRATQRCPKCANTKFVVTARFCQPDHGSANSVEPFPAVTVTVPGFLGDRELFGRFETWICARCGLTEFYAYELGDIERAARERPDQVRIVDATAAVGAFR